MTTDQTFHPSTTIVIVDDDKLSTHNLTLQFRFMGEHPRCITSDNWRTLLKNLQSGDEYQNLIAVVVGQTQRSSQKELLASLRDYDAQLPLLVVNQHPLADEAALETEQFKGQVIAIDSKALNYERLSQALEAAAAYSGRKRQVPESAIISPSGSALFRSLSGSNQQVQQLRDLIAQVAMRDVTTLIQGESGSGKEVVARNLHYHSQRRGKPFIAINCAALVPEGMGAELFGCEDQLNGQARIQPGLLEQADGGSVFFDQISELPMNLQAVLLRFLEDQQFQRIGGYQFNRTNVRVLAGTRQPLEDLVARDRFRKDLYYRLNTMPLQVPPLRERLDDIPELIKELIARLESKGYPAIRLNAAAVQSLQRHDWPGNVRELANLIERLSIIHPERVTGLQDLPVQYQYQETDVVQGAGDTTSGAGGPGQTTASTGSIQAGQTGTETSTAGISSSSVTNAEHRDSAAATSGLQAGPGGLILPLTPEKLEQYLLGLERQLLQTALDDCAGLLSFTAERLAIDESDLQSKLQLHALI